MDGIRETEGALVCAARAQGVLDLAFGEGLHRLLAGRRLLHLGYATERDYARERLGLPARTMYDALELGRACDGRPILRKAVAAGLVSPCHARAIAAVVGSNEAGWTALAMTSTVRELRASVRAAGKEPPEEFETESLLARMTPAQQDKLEEALARADETLGGGAPLWQRLDALAQEYLGEHGGEEDLQGAGGTSPGSPPEPPGKPLPDPVVEHLKVIEEAKALVEDRAPQTTDPRKLDAFLLRLVNARKRHDAVVGALGLRIVDTGAWRAAGFATLEEYCTERLGMCPRLFRQRVWLERKMFALPALREALESGRLTYSKALLVARDATLDTIEDLIARAAGTTWDQTSREATEREDKRNRAAGVRRLWAPKDVMLTVAAAIRCAKRRAREGGRAIGTGEALVAIAEHFLGAWPAHRLRKVPKSRLDVLKRNHGRCQVPGCSLPARHVHHICYRSRGGAKEHWNETAICIPHHLLGIHEGLLQVEGRAGERLTWRFGNGEIWVTEGDNDVRRGDAADLDPAAAPAGADRVREPAPPAYAAAARVNEPAPPPRRATRREVQLPSAA